MPPGLVANDGPTNRKTQIAKTTDYSLLYFDFSNTKAVFDPFKLSWKPSEQFKADNGYSFTFTKKDIFMIDIFFDHLYANESCI